jgi:hypothetical protein
VRARQQGTGSVPTLEASILGLLALMIGFTFALALSRFEARREGVLNEATAIGTAALRTAPASYPGSQKGVSICNGPGLCKTHSGATTISTPRLIQRTALQNLSRAGG